MDNYIFFESISKVLSHFDNNNVIYWNIMCWYGNKTIDVKQANQCFRIKLHMYDIKPMIFCWQHNIMEFWTLTIIWLKQFKSNFHFFKLGFLRKKLNAPPQKKNKKNKINCNWFDCGIHIALITSYICRFSSNI